MFRASSCPSSGATTTAVAASGLPSELGGSSAVGCGWAGRLDRDQQHCYHHAPTVKPEAATAVVELLVMGVRKSETCWDVHKRHVINLRIFCIWLVDLFEIFELSSCCLVFDMRYVLYLVLLNITWAATNPYFYTTAWTCGWDLLHQRMSECSSIFNL